MVNYLDKVSNPYEMLFGLIKICNKGQGRCFISNELKLDCTGGGDKAPKSKVVSVFFKYLQKRVSSNEGEGWREIPLKTWQEMKLELCKFVDQEPDELNLYRAIVSNVQTYIDRLDPLSRVKILAQKQYQMGQIDVPAIRCLEEALERISSERVTLYLIFLQEAAEFLKNYLLEEFEACQGRVKPLDDTRFSIDWEQIPKQTPEEFAVSLRLERAHSDAQRELKPTLSEILTEIENNDPGLQSILHKWQLFLAICEMDRVARYFSHRLQTKIGPFCDYQSYGPKSVVHIDELKEAFEHVFAKAKSSGYLSLPKQDGAGRRAWLQERLSALCVIVNRFTAQVDGLNKFYEWVHKAYSAAKSQHTLFIPQDVSEMLNGKILTPEEFRKIHLPIQSAEHLTASCKGELNRFLFHVGIEDDSCSLRALLRYIHGRDTFDGPIDPVVLFCKDQKVPLPVCRRKIVLKPALAQAVVIEEFANLKIATPAASSTLPKMDKKVAQLQVAKDVPQMPLHQLPPAPPPEIVKAPRKRKPKNILGANPRPIFADERVRAWSREPASQAKFLHTYPFIVTQIIRKVIPQDSWPSSVKPGRVNVHYVAPGAIHSYADKGVPLEGRFTECFDSTHDLLYHHFFEVVPFSKQLRQQDGLTQELKKALDQENAETKNTDLVAEQSVQEGRFVLSQTRYTITVDDTVNKILYTICLRS